MSDKIIPSIIMHPGELAPFPLNSNVHPPGQIEELAESRKIFSQYRNTVVWRCPEDMEVDHAGQVVQLKRGITYVLAGNGFHAASLKRQDDSIEVKDYSHLSLDEAILLAETDNAAPLGSKINPELMRANLDRVRSLHIDNERMTAMLERAREMAGVNGNGADAGKDTEPQIDRAGELQEKWGTRLGQVWELGPHLLVCGDCTDKAAVEAVMRGERADFINIDPPYGVDYSGQSSTMYYGKNKKGKDRTKLQGDNIEISFELTTSALNEIVSPCLFLWHAPQHHTLARLATEKANYQVFSVIVWNKNQANFGAMGARYKPKFEMALACKTDTIPWFGPNNEVTVWEVDRNRVNEFHPTEKPVPLFERAIGNHTTQGNVVYDGFLGSGTTIIAAHNLNRRARAIEISPAYCAVTIQRFFDHTQIEPKLL